jgi:AAA15 family ATPase/GTPase
VKQLQFGNSQRVFPSRNGVIMLLDFAFGNFRSFKGKVEISLRASGDDWQEEDSVAELKDSGLRLVKTAVIFGANASGKSNVIQALDCFRDLIVGSSKESQQGEPIRVAPFRLSTVTERAPSFFEATFLSKGGVRFRYGFEATGRAVKSEWLFRQASSIRETRLFTREGMEIDVPDAFKEGKGLEKRTRPNALFLSVVAQFNGAIAGEIVNCARECRTINGLSDAGYMPFTTEILDDPKFGPLLRELVRRADTGIEEIIKQAISKEQVLDGLPKEIPPAIREIFAKDVTGGAVIKTVHHRYNGQNKPAGTVEFDLGKDESAGTRQFLALAGPFLHTLSEGAVLFVDELNASLHPLLTRQLVQMFNSSANRKNAQLVFATHDQTLLNRNLLRRDQIWFVEKDQWGASDLFRLDSVKGLRKDANFEKEYITGQLGAVPRIGDFQGIVKNAEK